MVSVLGPSAMPSLWVMTRGVSGDGPCMDVLTASTRSTMVLLSTACDVLPLPPHVHHQCDGTYGGGVWVTTTDYVIPLWIMDPRSPYPVDVILLLVFPGDHQRTMVSVYLCTLTIHAQGYCGIPCTGCRVLCLCYPYHEWWVLGSSIWGTG